MLSKSAALNIMEKHDGKGTPTPFQIEFVTGNREAWRKYKLLNNRRLNHNKDSQEWKEITEMMDSMDLGGRIINHDSCVLSKPRGIHAKKRLGQMSRKPNHWKNKTRNIRFLPGEQIRKIHIGLILEINQQAVTF
jgi:hypothetical protein